MSMSPHYSRLPHDMTIEPQDPRRQHGLHGRQHGLPEPQPSLAWRDSSLLAPSEAKLFSLWS